jgi:hypothetical protein
MGRWRMLGEVGGLIGFAGFPVDNELALLNLVADPVDTHVHCSKAAIPLAHLLSVWMAERGCG